MGGATPFLCFVVVASDAPPADTDTSSRRASLAKSARGLSNISLLSWSVRQSPPTYHYLYKKLQSCEIVINTRKNGPVAAKMLQKPPCENAAKATVLVGRRNSRKQLNGTVHYPSWGGGHVRQARGLGAYDTYAQKGACGGLAILFRRALWPKIPLKSS